MSTVVTIYEAKTQLSKYIKQAKAGRPVYIGSYGEKEVVLMATPKKRRIVYGTAAGKFAYDERVFKGADPDIQNLFYGQD